MQEVRWIVEYINLLCIPSTYSCRRIQWYEKVDCGGLRIWKWSCKGGQEWKNSVAGGPTEGRQCLLQIPRIEEYESTDQNH